MSRPRQYPDELRLRAVRMVQEVREQTGRRHGAVTRVARQLGISRETLRQWVNRAEVEAGRRPGLTGAEADRIRQLEAENRELARANEILRAASAFFARELDPRPPR